MDVTNKKRQWGQNPNVRWSQIWLKVFQAVYTVLSIRKIYRVILTKEKKWRVKVSCLSILLKTYNWVLFSLVRDIKYFLLIGLFSSFFVFFPFFFRSLDLFTYSWVGKNIWCFECEIFFDYTGFGKLLLK